MTNFTISSQGSLSIFRPLLRDMFKFLNNIYKIIYLGNIKIIYCIYYLKLCNQYIFYNSIIFIYNIISIFLLLNIGDFFLIIRLVLEINFLKKINNDQE